MRYDLGEAMLQVSLRPVSFDNPQKNESMKTIHLISLGCAKNLVDSERLLASAMVNFKLTPTDDPAGADLIIVNTCAFLQSAAEEALAVIMEAGAVKKAGAVLLVAGCLPSRYQDENPGLAAGLPEVDLWLPPADYHLFEERLYV